jgi:hypothetical protein
LTGGGLISVGAVDNCSIDIFLDPVHILRNKTDYRNNSSLLISGLGESHETAWASAQSVRYPRPLSVVVIRPEKYRTERICDVVVLNCSRLDSLVD